MKTITDQERWVLAVGDVVDLVAAEKDATIVDRLPHVVLVRTSYRKATELRRQPNAIVQVYDSAQAGRRAFSLFEPS